MSIQSRQKLINAIKISTGASGPVFSIPIGHPVEAILRPVSTNKDCLSADDVRFLTKWRNCYSKSFFTEFEATKSRTVKWLTEIVGPDETRILFMIDDIFGTTVGCIGLASIDWEKGSAEADSVIRGEDAPSGTMTRVLHTLIKWAQGQLSIQNIWVRVRSDNTAIEFYQKVGFNEIKRIPLRKVEDTSMIRWVEDKLLPFSEVSVAYMVYAEIIQKAESKFLKRRNNLT